MGGKSKTSQRTKNNVRPSSSGRSAGLLSVPGVSFLKGEGGSFGKGEGGSLLAALAREPVLPDSLALAFKKLSKKDPITKIKGLQELTTAVRVRPQDAAAALAAWAAQYRLLATDPDRRVRDHAQQCQQAMMCVCGRAAAPYLRSLLPVWLLAAHEPGAPAARALHALTDTFPGHKLDQAILHCKEDIATMLHDILTTPVVDNKIETAAEEEAMSMCAWRAVCALGALQRLAGATGGEEWAQGRVGALLNDKHFWKLATHTDQNVRSAWYGCMGCLGSLGLLGAAAARVLARLVAPLETGAANAQRWGAITQLMGHYPQQEWYGWVDHDLLETRIMNLLETGGWGCARGVHAVVLDLLQLLPPEALTARFHSRLFDALFAGMQCNSVSLSVGERLWWAALVGDCVRHGACAAHGRRLVADAVARWVAAATGHTKQRKQWVVVTAAAAARLALHWLRARTQHHDHLVALWAATSTAQDVHTHMQLLHTMATCLDDKRPAFRERVKKGVTFKDECIPTDTDRNNTDTEDKSESKTTRNTNDNGKSEANTTDPEDSSITPAIREEYMKELRTVVAKAVAYWLDSGSKSNTLDTVIPPLLPVVSALNSPALWSDIALECGTSDVLELYRTKLSIWLRGPVCSPLASVLVIMVQQADQQQRECIYQDWDQLPDSVVQSLVWASVSGGGSKDEGWRGGSRAGAILQHTAREALQGDPRAMEAMHLALTDPDVTSSTLQAVSTALTAHLSSALQTIDDVIQQTSEDHTHQTYDDVTQQTLDDVILGPCCSLAALLATALADQERHCHTEFVIAIWRLISLTQPDGGALSTAEWSEAARAACRTLRAMDGAARAAAARNIHDTIRDYVFNSHGLESLPLSLLSHYAALTALLARCVPKATTALVALSREQGAVSRVLVAALRVDLVKGTLASPLHDNYLPLQEIIEDSESLQNNIQELTKKTLVQFLQELLFRAKVIHNLVKRRDKDIGTENDESVCNTETSKDPHTESGSNTETSKGLHTESGSNTETSKDPHTESGSNTETSKGLHTESGSNTETSKGLHTESGSNTETSKDPHTESGSNTETSKGLHTESGSYTECKQTDTHTVSEVSNVIDVTKTEDKEKQLDFTDLNKHITDKLSLHDVGEKHANDNLNENVNQDSTLSITGQEQNLDESVDNKLQLCEDNNLKDDRQDSAKSTNNQEVGQSVNSMKQVCVEHNYNKNSNPLVINDTVKALDDVEPEDEVIPLEVWGSVCMDEPSEWLQQELPRLLHDHAVLEALLRNYPYWSEYPVMSSTHKLVTQTCTRILQTLPPVLRNAVLEALAKEAGGKGLYWAAAGVRWGAKGDQGEDISANGYFHTLQMQSLNENDTFRLSVHWAVSMRCIHSAVAAHDALAAAALSAVAAIDHEQERTDVLLKVYYEQPKALHVDCPSVVPSWAVTCAAACCARYLRALVACRGWQLLAPHWDLATLAADNYVTAVHSQRQHLHNDKISMLSVATLELAAAVQAFTSSVPTRCLQQQPSEHVAALPREWADVFAPHIVPLMHDLLLHLLKSYTQPVLPCTVVSVLVALQPCLGWAAGTTAAGRAALLTAAVTALTTPAHPVLHATAYLALAAVTKQLAEDDEAMLSAWGSQSTEEGASSPRPRLAAAALAEGLKRALEPLSEAPGADPEAQGASVVAQSYGVLLMAEVLSRITQGSDDKDIGVHYAHIYEEQDFIEPLVQLCLQQLPDAVAAHAYGTAPAPHAARLFASEPCVHSTDNVTADTISSLCCRALYTVLTNPSVARARHWYGAADVRARRAMERIVRAYVAPQHIRHVMATLGKHRDEFDEADLLMHPTTGEITVSLLVEEKRLALVCSLPELFPLSAARLRGAGLAAAPALAARGALGGGTRRALLLWANAVRRRIDAQPPCYVCYARLHPASGQLPAATCRTCHNTFHTQCIRKWFQTSQKANCPLCRSVF